MRYSQVHRSLLTETLLPLHQPNQMAVWSIQQPLIESYHEALVGCLIPFLERQTELVQVVLEAVVASWPEGFNSNTPKVLYVVLNLPKASTVQLYASCTAITYNTSVYIYPAVIVAL